MLAAQIYREWNLGVLTTRLQQASGSRVARCLFGQPSSRDTLELLQEALDAERARFAKRWAVDPLAEDEDKENAVGGKNGASGPGGGKIAVVRLTPGKRRPGIACPYAKQTCISDYWRSRKLSESGKKTASGVLTEVKQNQQQPQPSQQNLIDKFQSPSNQ